MVQYGPGSTCVKSFLAADSEPNMALFSPFYIRLLNINPIPLAHRYLLFSCVYCKCVLNLLCDVPESPAPLAINDGDIKAGAEQYNFITISYIFV